MGVTMLHTVSHHPARTLASLLAGLALGALTCGDDPVGSGTGGAGGASSTSSTSTSAAGGAGGVSTTGSTSSAPPMCDGTLYDQPCGPCLEDRCCAELISANGNGAADELVTCAQQNCTAECFSDVLFPYECSIPPLGPAELAAADGSCVALTDTVKCNPVTQTGCDQAPGGVCDFDTGGFGCYYDDSAVQNVCEPCGMTGSDYCVAGFACIVECARYCCVDADCNGGTCLKVAKGLPIFAEAPDLGLCAAPAP
jgi:hypothetical protein